MSRNKLLLTAVFGPYGIKDKYAEELGCQMELLNNQITREQGVHSPRQSYWSFGLYMLANNISVDTNVLDFPRWEEFTKELQKGYTHVGISFIVPNILKAIRMTEYIRENHPEIKIILGGYGTIIPELKEMLPYDEVCRGEGVRWLRQYFGDDVDAPVKHPVLIGPAYEYLYGYKSKPNGGILMPGLGCENGCTFCITSHNFNKTYVPLLKTGKEVFDACENARDKNRTRGFSIMDENFLKQTQRARELLVEMEKNDRPYVFDLFSSAETVKLLGVDFLVRLGVHLLWVGVESKDSKAYSKNDGIDMAALIKELQEKGIVVQASMILFQDHHDKENIHEDIDWVIGLDSNLAQFMNYTPYPTTSLYEKYKGEGRLKDVHYRHQHGQGQLVFEHPHFPDPNEHVDILREAFRRKYLADGPGILNMAITAINGYEKAQKDYLARKAEGLAWNPETLRYEKSDKGGRDRFMKRRIRVMHKIAKNIRTVLWATWVYAPNSKARRKSAETMKRFREVFGKPSFLDMLKASVLVATGFVESIRTRVHKLFGRESVVLQPPSRITNYPEDISVQKGKSVDRAVA